MYYNSSHAKLVPVGGMLQVAFNGASEGFLQCDGSSLSREVYPELFEAIGTQYGALDDKHFSIPDKRNTGEIWLIKF